MEAFPLLYDASFPFLEVAPTEITPMQLAGNVSDVSGRPSFPAAATINDPNPTA
jgi:hypothetical protein